MTTTCPRCTGKDGAHYMECVIGRLFERIMGSDYPWKAPMTPVPQIAPKREDDLFARLATVVDEDEAEAEAIRRAGEEYVQLTQEQPEPAPYVPRRRRPPLSPSRAASMTKTAEARRDQVIPWVRKFADDCLILGNPEHNGVSWVNRSDYVPGPVLYDAYNEWREEHHPEAMELERRDVTIGMKGIGYTPRQSILIDGVKPAVFYGVILRPKLNWGQPRATERAAEEDHTAEIRRIAKAAKVAARPEPEPEPAPEPVVVPQVDGKTNNGWFKAPTTGGNVDVPTLTIEDIEAENAARTTTKTRVMRDFPPPGRELPKEYRELIAPLLDLPGWRYAPNNGNGKGKPRIWNPRGKMFCLPNTPSDVKGIMACKTMLKNSLGAPL